MIDFEIEYIYPKETIYCVDKIKEQIDAIQGKIKKDNNFYLPNRHPTLEDMEKAHREAIEQTAPYINEIVKIYQHSIPKIIMKVKKMIHELKTIDPYYDDILEGIKKFEIRLNDRDFKVGDNLILHNTQNGKCTGLFIRAKIIYITDFMQKENYIVMGIEIEK